MQIAPPSLEANAPLAALNTLRLVAKAQWLAHLTHLDSLPTLLAQPELAGLPVRVLGGGSNLVLADDVPGLIIRVENRGKCLLKEDHDAWYVQVAGGENWHDFVQWTLAQGWHGLENLSLIPGTAGACPVQNVGAYGVEVADVLHSLTAWSLESGLPRVYSRDECQFAYRDSIFKREATGQWLIGEVVFRLPKQAPLRTGYGEIERELSLICSGSPTPVDVAQAVMQVRQRKLPDPAVIGNAGSFFKNPLVSAAVRNDLLARFPALVSYAQADGQFKLAAGWLIEQAGWKGKQLGPVGMYEKQALVLVNHGGANGHDVERLARAVIVDVKALFGVEIEPEPVWWP